MTFEAVRSALRQKCADMPIDGESFARRVAQCALPDCRGMCCYDGVHLDAPTEAAVTILAQTRRPELTAMGLDLPDAVVVDGYVGGVPYGRKTATRAWAVDAVVKDVPEHFTRTCCVFHLDDGRCGLQVLAVQDGVHPWTYKPSSCWLFPITIHGGTIKIFNKTNDPSRFEAYKGFVEYTRCGQTCAAGQPAIEVLTDELRYLGEVIGRDLVAEVVGQAAG